MKFKWEYIEGSCESQSKTMRAKVVGGWLILHRLVDEDFGSSESMVFIPDPHREWKIEES